MLIAAIVQLILGATKFRSKLKIVPLVVISLVGLWAAYIYNGLFSDANGVELDVYSWAPLYSPIVTIIVAMELASFGAFVVYYKGVHPSITSDFIQTVIGFVVGNISMIGIEMFMIFTARYILINTYFSIYFYVVMAIFAVIPLFLALKYKKTWVFNTVLLLTFLATIFIFNSYFSIGMYLNFPL